jgi:Reverse transcriptase (RNA-dependent DNA polymerase)/RNase H-like domain found in reverse transcriptase
MVKLSRPLTVVYHDGRRSKHQINYCVQLPITFGDKKTNAYYLVSRTDSRWPVTLGLPWFNRYIPELERSLAIFFNSQTNQSEEYLDEVSASYAQVNEVLMVGGVTSTPTETLPQEFLDDADIFNEKDLPSLKEPLKPYFRINVKDEDLPPPAKNIPRSPKQLEEEDRWLKQYLADGKIRESFSKTAAASFFVNKQCTGCHQLRCSCGKYDYPQRMVLDMRLLNAKEKQDPYPLPNIAEVMLQAAGHKFYFKGDIVAAFENLGVHPDDRHKTAFICSRGIYEWLVMSFGYINAPAHWQRYIDTILLPVRQFCRAYMDDLVVWADTYEEYVSRVKQVLQILRQTKLRLKLRKCEFFKNEISYLGHILGEKGTRMDPEKVKALDQWPEPRTKKDLKGFAAFASYYRNYIKNLAEALIPIYDGIKDDAPNVNVATDEIMESFKRVKQLFVETVQLTPYDPTAETLIHTDASSMAWGGEISQNGKPLAFISGKFKDTERRWPTTDREAYPLVRMHEKFHYLLQGNTIWHTDHKAHESLRTTLMVSPRRQNWLEILNRFPWRVRYKKGKEMHVDGMTRHSTFPQDNGFNGKEPLLNELRLDLSDPFTLWIALSNIQKSVNNAIKGATGSASLQGDNLKFVSSVSNTLEPLIKNHMSSLQSPPVLAASARHQSPPEQHPWRTQKPILRLTRTDNPSVMTASYTALLTGIRGKLAPKCRDWMKIGAKIFSLYTRDLQSLDSFQAGFCI